MVGSMPRQRFAVRLSVADEGVVEVEAERQPGGQYVAGGGAQECAVVRRVRAAVQVAHEQGAVFGGEAVGKYAQIVHVGAGEVGVIKRLLRNLERYPFSVNTFA